MNTTNPPRVPLDQWSLSRLKFEVAILLGLPKYLMMFPKECRERGLPATEDQMRAYIRLIGNYWP